MGADAGILLNAMQLAQQVAKPSTGLPGRDRSIAPPPPPAEDAGRRCSWSSSPASVLACRHSVAQLTEERGNTTAVSGKNLALFSLLLAVFVARAAASMIPNPCGSRSYRSSLILLMSERRHLSRP